MIIVIIVWQDYIRYQVSILVRFSNDFPTNKIYTYGLSVIMSHHESSWITMSHRESSWVTMVSHHESPCYIVSHHEFWWKRAWALNQLYWFSSYVMHGIDSTSETAESLSIFIRFTQNSVVFWIIKWLSSKSQHYSKEVMKTITRKYLMCLEIGIWKNDFIIFTT